MGVSGSGQDDGRARCSVRLDAKYLEAYDVIFVPKSTIARINLAVEQYIRRMLPFNLFTNASYSWLKDEAANNPAFVTVLP
jgi:hypothetical protein